ncbi:MAG: hypothetical protein CSA22_02510 [Deltaproteobacteria bacterium]|nr:MAG: hypothetical protein CSA22_02510 [Deltaproteobacteria bacterium]
MSEVNRIHAQVPVLQRHKPGVIDDHGGVTVELAFTLFPIFLLFLAFVQVSGFLILHEKVTLAASLASRSYGIHMNAGQAYEKAVSVVSGVTMKQSGSSGRVETLIEKKQPLFEGFRRIAFPGRAGKQMSVFKAVSAFQEDQNPGGDN